MVDGKNEIFEPRKGFLSDLASHQSLISDRYIGQSEPVHEGSDDILKHLGPVIHLLRVEGHEKMGWIGIGKVGVFELE